MGEAETREDRLKEYIHLFCNNDNKIKCPVCNKEFLNKYSLSNHFLIRGNGSGLIFSDNDHEIYWNNKKEEENIEHKKEVRLRIYNNICRRCKKNFEADYDHRFSKQCPECAMLYPPKIKKSTRYKG